MAAIYKNFMINQGSELELLYYKPFKECAEFISKMDTLKKADIAAQIQPILKSLYDQTDRYGNPEYSRDDQIGPDVFQLVMSKIKRWETILYWLYEIDIMMSETKLDQMVKEAQERWIKTRYNPDATRIRMEMGDDGKKHRKMVNVREDYEGLVHQQIERGLHTEEIMDMAAELAKKYYK